jgi:hypothetical protein
MSEEGTFPPPPETPPSPPPETPPSPPPETPPSPPPETPPSPPPETPQTPQPETPQTPQSGSTSETPPSRDVSGNLDTAAAVESSPVYDMIRNFVADQIAQCKTLDDIQESAASRFSDYFRGKEFQGLMQTVADLYDSYTFQNDLQLMDLVPPAVGPTRIIASSAGVGPSLGHITQTPGNLPAENNSDTNKEGTNSSPLRSGKMGGDPLILFSGQF